MLSSGASVVVHDIIAKRTPLHAAAGNGHADCIMIMLRYLTKSSHIDVVDSYGRAPLMLAVTNGYANVVQALIEQGAQVDCADKYLCTALHRAVICGFDECVELLLSARADPTARDQRGRTPVHFAALCGHLSIVEMLIQSGGSPSTPDKHGYTPIHWAAYNGHEKCLEVLVDKDGDIMAGNAFTPLHCCIINDNESCAELLLDKAGSELVNCQDNGGRTPIHAAAFNDHVECMQLLLRYNAAADIFDNSGKTPLMMAAGYGHSSAVELLMGLPIEKLSMEHSDQSNNTALHLACLKGHEECALAILSKCTDVLIHKTNIQEKTPLHISAKSGLSRVVQELIKRGANLNVRDADDNIPALCCAPNQAIADCLECILQAMLEQKGVVL